MTTPIIFDGHNDVLLDLYQPESECERSFFIRSEYGHLDLPRMREGGMGGGFFAVFAPNPNADSVPGASFIRIEPNADTPLPPPLDFDYAQKFSNDMVNLLFEIEAKSAGQLKIARTFGELESCLKQNTMAAVLHIEGAEAIEPDLSNLEYYYRRGLRSLGIVWSRPNAFGEGVPFRFPHSPNTGPGLTKAGKALVRECNRLGILIDLSHLNERGFWDVARLSTAPLVASHTAAHTLSPASRNLTDSQIDAIGESGGVIGVNFNISFTRSDGQRDLNTPLTVIAGHVAYIAGRTGVEHVALGSDFDGATIPNALSDASGLPRLMTALQDAGFDDDALRKITHQNWLRVLRETWR